jgi:hypothetical protein
MKISRFFIIALLSIAAAVLTRAANTESGSIAPTPVLIELFTSEGCSSCPPADALLQKLDGQPIAGEQLIVLSEHVDYWNHIGWRDPYSAPFYSDRQGTYGKRFGLDSVYTPQMVVDGTSEFTGSNSDLAEKALAKARAVPKIPVLLSAVSRGPVDVLQAHLQTGSLEASYGLRKADVYAAVAFDHAESQVANGENAGHTLTHTAVVRNIVKVGSLRLDQTFAQDILLKLDPGSAGRPLRLIVFVQEPGQGRVIGAAVQNVSSVAARP